MTIITDRREFKDMHLKTIRGQNAFNTATIWICGLPHARQRLTFEMSEILMSVDGTGRNTPF